MVMCTFQLLLPMNNVEREVSMEIILSLQFNSIQYTWPSVGTLRVVYAFVCTCIT